MRIKQFFIRVNNAKLADIGIEDEEWEEPVSIDMDRVESIWRNIHDADGAEGTTIVMHSGSDYTVLEQYDKVLEIWMKDE